MESENDKSHSEKSGTSSDTDQQWMEMILRSPTKKARLLQQMGLDDNRFTNKDAEGTPACASGGKGAGVATGQGEQRHHATGGGNLPFVGCLQVMLTPGQFFRLRAGPRSGEFPDGLPLLSSIPRVPPRYAPLPASLWHGLGIPNDWACTAE